MNVESVRESPDVSGIQMTEHLLSETAGTSRKYVCVHELTLPALLLNFYVFSILSETLPTLRGNPFTTSEDEDADKTYLPMSDSESSETESDVSSDDDSTE